MNVQTKRLFNIEFVNHTFDDFISILKNRLMEEKKTFVITANPISVNTSKENESFKNAMLSADFVTPDGVGILLAAKMLNNRVTERIAGYDVMVRLLLIANEQHSKIYLYGAHPDVLKLTVKQINQLYPNIKMCGYMDGYSNEQDDLINQIKTHRPDLIFVALGVPKQEVWIHNHIHTFEKGIFIGVGGSFDVLSGTINRAPTFFQKVGLEWLYRMVSQPSRLTRLVFVPKFFVHVIKEKFKSS